MPFNNQLASFDYIPRIECGKSLVSMFAFLLSSSHTLSVYILQDKGIPLGGGGRESKGKEESGQTSLMYKKRETRSSSSNLDVECTQKIYSCIA